jgi:cyanophycinase
MKLIPTTTALVCAMFLASCGGGSDGGSNAPSDPPSLAGQLTDIENVAYVTSSGLSGRTGSGGSFQYRAGDSIRFSIGKLELGNAPAQAVMSLLSIVADSSDITSAQATKLAQILQALDSDQDSGNGIQISGELDAPLNALANAVAISTVSATQVMDWAYGANAPTLATPETAMQLVARIQGAAEARAIINTMPSVNNIVIGGGIHNCSSFNGAGQSTYCSKPWSDIVSGDPAFADLTLDRVLFDPAVTLPTFTYSITSDRINRLNALPASLIPADIKASLSNTLTTRLNTPARNNTGLTYAQFDDGKPLFADGLAFWSSGNHTDWLLVIAAMCDGLNGDASSANTNGKFCVMSDANINTVASATFQVPDDREKVVVVLRELQRLYGLTPILYRRNASGVETTPNFRAEFRLIKLAQDGTAPAPGLTLDLTPTQVAALRHTFVDTLVPDRRDRQVQARSVVFLNDRPTVDIYREFVRSATAMAGGKKPTIGIVTASTENPYNDRDINYYALKSAGANVIWLPADGGMRKAIDAADCQNLPIYYTAYANTASVGSYFHMDQVFPDLADLQLSMCSQNAAEFDRTLGQLDGIFFTGGDQARHLESFITRDGSGAYTVLSNQIRVLRERYQSGKLVVAGTSAGDSAQTGGLWKGASVPMIAGGDSWQALANGFVDGSGPTIEGAGTTGTRYPGGGLGFFEFGPLDSHFTNRSREGRLIRLVKEGGVDYGFGVDENTALVVGRLPGGNGTRMTVVGEAGVFVVDARNATASGLPLGNYSIDNVHVHYLTEGDMIDIDGTGDMRVTLSSSKPMLQAVPGAPLVTQNRVQESGTRNFLKMAQSMALTGAAKAFGTTEGTSGQSAPAYSFTASRTPATVFRGSSDKISYSGVTLSVNPCAGTCVAPN